MVHGPWRSRIRNGSTLIPIAGAAAAWGERPVVGARENMRSTTFTCLGAIALAFSSGCSDAKKHNLNELKTIAVDYGNTIVERSQAASSQIVEKIKAII